MINGEVKRAVKKVLDMCLQHELQLKLNMQGKTGWKSKSGVQKFPFEGTILCKVITGKSCQYITVVFSNY